MHRLDARPQYQAAAVDARVTAPGAFAAACSWSIIPLSGMNTDRKHVRPRPSVDSP